MSRPGNGQPALPFQNTGSFCELYTAVQQQSERDRQYHAGQQPAQLASVAAPPPPDAPEEGEIPADQQHQQYAYQCQPDGGSDAYQWQLQQQYDAYPTEQNERQYAEAYQQAQYSSYQQQHRHQDASTAAAAAQAGEEKDFNSCDAWFGPWPGFCFKLGSEGLGYYRDKPPAPAASAAKAVAGAAVPAKPKVILGNNSIIKGLAPKPGGVAKRKKQGEVDTRTERNKMMDGDLYYSFGPKGADLEEDRAKCRVKVAAYNRSGGLSDEEQQLRLDMLVDLFGSVDTSTRPFIEPPFSCDYGYNIHLGKDVYANFGCVFLDCNTITIGDRVLFAPNVQLYTAGHPLDPAKRNGTSGPEFARPITIGNDCWIGGSVIVLPGVTIGEGSTVGAGSVVTKDVEPYTVVAGNPARVVRHLERPQAQQQEG